MDLDETGTQSFIIRIWPEKVELDGSVRWRGHITHVPSRDRVYLQDLENILTFIAPYLQFANTSTSSRPNGP